MSKHFLDIAVWGIVPIKNYRGALVEKAGVGYKVFGDLVHTAKEVDKKIDQAANSVKNSLK